MHLEFGECPQGKSSPRKKNIMAQERDDEAHGDAEGLANLRSLLINMRQKMYQLPLKHKLIT